MSDELIARLKRPLGGYVTGNNHVLTVDRADDICLERREAVVALEAAQGDLARMEQATATITRLLRAIKGAEEPSQEPAKGMTP